MCGTQYVVGADYIVILQQREFTEHVDTVSNTNKRKRDLEGEQTTYEFSLLRVVAGSGQWLATQTETC